jgi:AraC family transcriptional regulator
MTVAHMSNPAPVRIVDDPGRLLAGLTEQYVPARCAEIPRQWQRFARYLGQIPGQVGRITYGVITPAGAGAIDYLCGVEIAREEGLLPGLSTLRVPAQRYAVFCHPDQAASISETMSAIHSNWLPVSGHRAANGPALERYGERFDPSSGRGDIELWLPIEP